MNWIDDPGPQRCFIRRTVVGHTDASLDGLERRRPADPRLRVRTFAERVFLLSTASHVIIAN